jgi:hypothetical protein
MPQTIPASIQLSPRRAGQSIGYAVLNLDRTPYAPFTRRGVVTAADNRLAVRGGVEAPDAGGYLVWRTTDGDAITESDIAPAPLAAGALETLRRLVAGLPEEFAALVPAPVVDLTPFLAGVAQMSEAQAAAVAEYRARLVDVAELLTRIAETTDGLSVLNEGANQVMALAEMRNRLNSILGEPSGQPSGLRAVQEMSVAPLTSAIEGLRGDMAHFVERVSAGQHVDERRAATVAALDAFLERVGA